jgi:hypothetical protein
MQPGAPNQGKIFFRPKCSAGHPLVSEPITVPESAMLMASPCKVLSNAQSDWMICSAQEITSVSNPNRNPAREATTALLYKKIVLSLLLLFTFQQSQIL